MNFNSKRAKCSAKSFFRPCMLLKLKKITFFTVKDQLNMSGGGGVMKGLSTG